jgi:hypothetical protein
MKKDAFVTEYSRLKGKTVENVVKDPNGIYASDEVLYGLEFTDGTIAWIMSNPEGNGAGFLEIATRGLPS